MKKELNNTERVIFCLVEFGIKAGLLFGIMVVIVAIFGLVARWLL